MEQKQPDLLAVSPARNLLRVLGLVDRPADIPGQVGDPDAEHVLAHGDR
jgi:hypothetical protein